MMFRIFAALFLGISSLFSGVAHTTTNLVSQVTGHSPSTEQASLSQDQLLAMAGNPYANGNIPLGDNKYITTGSKQGYVYLCNIPRGNGGGAQNSGSWITGSTWNPSVKPHVEGSVSWSTAQFSNSIQGTNRVISGNGLPMGMTTGIFPISSSDPASQYDRNPNSIKAQTISLTLPASPTYSATPYCMGMEVGIMLNGVPLFNGFDAELRDAAAHEVQDSCDGHPEVTGEYHYHSLSSCFSDTSISTVLGFALDGFPITGNKVADGKYLETDNLDDCHGITSQIMLDGKEVTMYHYVMTQDFPYSVSCFRGKPVSYQVTGNGMQMGSASSPQMGQGRGNVSSSGFRQAGPGNMMRPMPPTEAFTICTGKTTGTSCSFTSPRGTVTGTCQNPSGQQIVCVPNSPEQLQGHPINY